MGINPGRKEIGTLHPESISKLFLDVHAGLKVSGGNSGWYWTSLTRLDLNF